MKKLVQVVNESVNPLPSYATDFSAGMDVKVDLTDHNEVKVFEGGVEFLPNGDLLILPQSRVLLPTRLKFAIPIGFEIQVRSRSGKALKEGLQVVQGVGTIDSDYRGYAGVCLVNLSAKAQKVKQSERVAQLILTDHDVCKWDEVDVLPDTVRGAGGFGHTGSN